jgi:tetraacyldisaccharide 4'-kinase
MVIIHHYISQISRKKVTTKIVIRYVTQMKRIDAYWYSKNPVALILMPVSWVYCCLVIIRRWFYQIGFFKSSSLPVPVIIIGNIAVGGTGKTPLLIALCELLEAQGIKAGVVSRGYRGNFSGERIVNKDSTPLEVGDEPFIIFSRTNCPVSVGSDRVAAAKLLLENYQCDIILSDDGLQHYRMHRDYEIAVIDTSRNHGNGFCLPAGPLRESVKRLQYVDLVVYHGLVDQNYSFNLKFSDAVNIKTREIKSIAEFMDTRINAIAGIGNPTRFFDQLRDVGLTIIEHAFQDHHIFNESDLDFNDSSVIFMTEKDAVKCHFYSDSNAWYIPVSAYISTAFSTKFLHDIKRLVGNA